MCPEPLMSLRGIYVGHDYGLNFLKGIPEGRATLSQGHLLVCCIEVLWRGTAPSSIDPPSLTGTASSHHDTARP